MRCWAWQIPFSLDNGVSAIQSRNSFISDKAIKTFNFDTNKNSVIGKIAS